MRKLLRLLISPKILLQVLHLDMANKAGRKSARSLPKSGDSKEFQLTKTKICKRFTFVYLEKPKKPTHSRKDSGSHPFKTEHKLTRT